MTKQSGLGDRLFVDGYDISGDIGALGRIASPRGVIEVTDITQEAFERLLTTKDGALEFTSYFNPASARAFEVLSALPTTDRIGLYCRGTSIGSPAAGIVGKQIGYDPSRGNDGSLTLTTAITASGYGLEWGELLTAGIRTDTSGTNGTGYDGGAATDYGLQAYLEVFSVTGTSVTVKLQDSADNSTFADITGATFTAATGRTAERIAISGTVRRYVRAVTTGTFTNAQFAVALVRNPAEVTF